MKKWILMLIFVSLSAIILSSAIASENSSEIQKTLQSETCIEKLPLAEQHDFLLLLSRGEKNLTARLNKRLQELAYQESG